MPAQLWTIIPLIAGPFALLALAIAVAGVILHRRESNRYEALKQTTDPAALQKMLQALTGTYVPQEDNIRIQDKVDILKQQQRDWMTRFKWMWVGGLIALLLVLITVVILALVVPPGSQGAEVPKGEPGELVALSNYRGVDWTPRDWDRISMWERRPGAAGDPPQEPQGPAPDDPLEDKFYPAVSFDLAKRSNEKSVKILSIRALHRPLPGLWVQKTAHVSHPNLRPPLLFKAELRNAEGSAEAVVIDEEARPYPLGLVTLTEAEQVARIVIWFAGEFGPSRVHVVVDVEGTPGGRRQQVRTTRCVLATPSLKKVGH